MGKTTCELKYRITIPYGWIAIPFVDTNFYGQYAKKYDEELKEIRYKSYKERDAFEKRVEELCDKLNKLIEIYSKRIGELSPKPIPKKNKNWFFRLFEKQRYTEPTQEDKDEIARLNSLKGQAIDRIRFEKHSLGDDDKKVEDNLWDKYFEAKRFLENKGFCLISRSEGECNTVTDIYSLED